MTSRLAATYGPKIASVAILSASFFYCPAGIDDQTCHSPKDSLAPLFRKGWHPPALITACASDELVDGALTQQYHSLLKSNGVVTEMPDLGCTSHRWPQAVVGHIARWFRTHASSEAGSAGGGRAVKHEQRLLQRAQEQDGGALLYRHPPSRSLM